MFDTAPIRVENGSIVILASVGTEPVEFVLDTGDAIGPVFNSADAERLGLTQGDPIQVEGAGGESTSFETTANVQFERRLYENEPSAIDTSLSGPSLLGLPFFLRETKYVLFDFSAGKLTVE